MREDELVDAVVDRESFQHALAQIRGGRGSRWRHATSSEVEANVKPQPEQAGKKWSPEFRSAVALGRFASFSTWVSSP
jgi:hypothetical protein